MASSRAGTGGSLREPGNQPLLHSTNIRIGPALLLLALLIARQACLAGEPEEFYFYKGLGYGSEANVHPLRLIVNGGYGIMQLDNRDRNIFEVEYGVAWDNLLMNLGDPVEAIDREGWGNFFFRQITPFSTNRASAQYWPNYTQHLIGGGMSYRLMLEWFRYHEYAHPRLMAVGTIAVYHFLNEMVENDGFVGYSTDPIADLYIFDPLSMLFFSSERVSRFFGETLMMAEWAYQPAIDPWTGNIENNAQNFIFKVPIPGSERYRLFYHYGTHGELGLSYTRSDGRCLSLAGGFKAKKLVELDEGLKTVDLALVAGIFYDRNNSLMASLIYAATKDYRLRLNAYPGLFRVGPLRPSFFLALSRDDRILVGVDLRVVKHLPFGIAGAVN